MILVAVAPACADGERGRDDAAPAGARLIGEIVADAPATHVVLLDPGREPRQILRYAFTPGARFRVEIDYSSRTEASMAGKPQTANATTTTGTMEIAIAGGAAGTLDVRLVAVDADWATVDPEHPDVVRREVQRIVGRVFRHRVDGRGFLVEDGARLPPDVEAYRGFVVDGITDLIDERVLLPEAAVGPGARWRIEAEDRHSWVARAIEEVELTAIHGETIDVAITRSAACAPQLMVARRDDVIGIDGLAAEGGGRATLDLRAPLPLVLDDRHTLRSEGRSIGPEELPLVVTATRRTRLHTTALAATEPSGR